MKKLITVLLMICLGITAFAQKIALIGAMDSEIEFLKNSMKNVTETKIGAITYYEGILEEKDVVLLKTGVGKVNAAIGADTVIREFKVESIIFTGVAGAVDNKLNIADIVVSKDLVQHDVDLTAFGRPMGLIPGSESIEFKADKNLIDIAYESAVKVLGKDKVKIGRIATGDQFIADKDKVEMIGKVFGASAVEMEGGAVAQVAHLYNIPFVVLRAVSDKADGSAKMTYEDFVIIAADNSANIVKEMLKKIK